MKVFEVITEYCEGAGKEVTRDRSYVTAQGDDFLLVVKQMVLHCLQYQKDLVSVAEVLTVVEHIKPHNQQQAIDSILEPQSGEGRV